MVLGQVDMPKGEMMNLHIDLTSFTKRNSKWIIDIHIKHKSMKLLGNSIGENRDDLGYGDDLLDKTSKAPSVKEIIDKLELIKIENFCSTKDNT